MKTTYIETTKSTRKNNLNLGMLVSKARCLFATRRNGNNRFRYLSNSLPPGSQQLRYRLLSVNHLVDLEQKSFSVFLIL